MWAWSVEEVFVFEKTLNLCKNIFRGRKKVVRANTTGSWLAGCWRCAGRQRQPEDHAITNTPHATPKPQKIVPERIKSCFSLRVPICRSSSTSSTIYLPSWRQPHTNTRVVAAARLAAANVTIVPKAPPLQAMVASPLSSRPQARLLLSFQLLPIQLLLLLFLDHRHLPHRLTS